MTTETEPHMRRKSKLVTPLHVIELLIIIGLLMWHFGVFKHTTNVALITSGEGPYWDRVEAGAKRAGEEYDVNVSVIRCKTDIQAQTDAIKTALAQGFDGIAVSPINPTGEAGALADIAGQSTLVTLDSDSPVARRLCFVGTDNYEAGRLCGQLVRDAIPDGGEVIIAMGNPDKQNTQRRRQGLIDELMDRAWEDGRPADAIDEPLKGAKYTIDTTMVDATDAPTTTELAAKATKDHPNVKCFVGLLSYSAPAIVHAVQDAGKDGQIKIVGFDVDDQTLTGIEQGKIAATIMQDQFGCGFQSVRILGGNARGNRTELPIFDKQTLPCTIVKKDNIADIRKRLSDAPSTQPS